MNLPLKARAAPTVTVLMAAHNEEQYIEEAIRSILGQSFSDFELILVDDASTDRTAAMVDAFPDPRMKVIRNATCLGLGKSLIVGMAAAKGSLIARMDADDISAPQRLNKQVAAFRKNPALGLLGCQATCIDVTGNRCGSRHVPSSDLAIRWRSLLDSTFIHPSVMFRADIYARAGGYDPEFTTTEDYDLWGRILPLCQVANLPSKLISYRLRPEGITHTRRHEQLDKHDRVSLRILAENGFDQLVPLESHAHLRTVFAGGIDVIDRNAMAYLVSMFWNLLITFYDRNKNMSGWTPLLMRERLRCLRRLATSPKDIQTWRACRFVLTPMGRHLQQ